jgi:hypothetical protein
LADGREQLTLLYAVERMINGEFASATGYST